MLSKNLKFLTPTLAVVAGLGQVSTSIGGELTFKSSVDSSVNIYDTSRNNEEYESSSALVIEPQLVSIFNSKKLLSTFVLSPTKVEKNGAQAAQDRNYVEYKLNSVGTIIDNMLSVSANIGQNYRVANQIDGFGSDIILSDGDLSKSESITGAINFALPNPNYVGFEWSAIHSQTKADKTIYNNQLDSSNNAFSSRIYKNDSKNFGFQLGARYNKTDRANNENFESRSVDGTVWFTLIEDISLVLIGNDSHYDFSQNTGNSNRPNNDTTTYGAGLKWAPHAGRFIQLTYNSLDETNKKTSYVGIDSAWAFSQRTSLNFKYDKRFYGDSYRANFNYNLKNFRTSFVYSEDVTTYSRLVFSTESRGLFVCPIGSADFSECFQPSGLDYVLAPGEEFRSATQLISDISDDVILSKSGQVNFGFDRRKLRVSLSLRVAETEYLESERLQKSKTAILSINYRLGKRSNLGLVSNFSRINQDTLVFNSDADTLSSTLSFDRELSPHAKMDVSFRYLDRDAQNLSRNLKDKRLALGFKYTF